MTEQNGKKRWRDMSTSEKIALRKAELKELQQQERRENRKARDHRLYFVAGTLENLLHEQLDKNLFLGGKTGGQYDKELITENELKEQLIKYANQLSGDESKPIPNWLNGMDERKFHDMKNKAMMFDLLCTLAKCRITKNTAPRDLARRIEQLPAGTLEEAWRQHQKNKQQERR